MERGASPAGQLKGKKCLTRLCKNYKALKKGHSHNKDENLTLTDDWDQVKPHLKRPREGRAATAERAAAAWSQIMRKGDMVNLFLDLDDRLPSLEEAKAKTDEMVEWAKTDLPPLLGFPAAWAEQNIAISTMPGQDPENPAQFKASAHVCVNGTVLEWCSTARYIQQKGIIAAAPQSAQTPGETMIDKKLYAKNRPVRLLGNGKPGDEDRWKRAVTCVNPSERAKHLPNWLHGNEEVLVVEKRILIPKNKKKAEQEKEKKAEVRKLTFEDLPSPKVPDCKALLLLCEPNMDYADWLSVSSFFKSKCGDLFDDEGREAWDEWMTGYTGNWNKTQDKAWDDLHDARDIKIGTLHHFAKKGPGGLLAYDDYQRQFRKPLEEWAPSLLTAVDHVPYVLETVDPLLDPPA